MCSEASKLSVKHLRAQKLGWVWSWVLSHCAVAAARAAHDRSRSRESGCTGLALALRSCARPACPRPVGGEEGEARRRAALLSRPGDPYCSEACSHADWKQHRRACKAQAAAAAGRDAATA